jgi:hypothetical protein
MAGADRPYPMPAPPHPDLTPAPPHAYLPPAPSHPLVGRFLADLPAEPAGRARPLLLDRTGKLRVGHERVEVVRVESGPADAVLVRPDGYVAWAGTPDETLEAALETWFGKGLQVTAK